MRRLRPRAEDSRLARRQRQSFLESRIAAATPQEEDAADRTRGIRGCDPASREKTLPVREEGRERIDNKQRGGCMGGIHKTFLGGLAAGVAAVLLHRACPEAVGVATLAVVLAVLVRQGGRDR